METDWKPITTKKMALRFARLIAKKTGESFSVKKLSPGRWGFFVKEN